MVGARGKVALLGHMGCLQCLVLGDKKYRLVLALSASPNDRVAQCDPFIPPQQDKRCAEKGK